MNYIFSSEKNLFYTVELRDQYKKNGDWPETFVEVDDDVYHEFISRREGKVRVSGADGLPAWADVPPPSHEDLVALAKQNKEALLDEAINITAMWRTELQLGIISDADKKLLTEWIGYYKAVQAVDTDATTDIEWPTMPTQ